MRLHILALALATASFLAPGSRVEAAAPPRVAEPAVHDNVALYFLHGPSAEGPVPLTLQEALAKGTVEVHETGSVRELRAENKGSDAVFLQMGDIVKGGRQDRVLTVSAMLSPNSGLVPLGAFCVERGRWSARGKEDARRFAQSEALLPSREAKVAIARPASQVSDAPLARAPRSPIEAELEGRRQRQAAEARRAAAENPREQRVIGRSGAADSQSEVWRSVDAVQRRLSSSLSARVESETSRTSLQLSLENERVKAAVETMAAALEPMGLSANDVTGVAVAINGRIVGADLYPSNGLFRKMWPKLVRAAATEAIGAKGESQDKVPTPADVTAFLAAAESGTASRRAIGFLGEVETREAATALKVKAMAPAAAGAGLVHESYIAK